MLFLYALHTFFRRPIISKILLYKTIKFYGVFFEEVSGVNKWRACKGHEDGCFHRELQGDPLWLFVMVIIVGGAYLRWVFFSFIIYVLVWFWLYFGLCNSVIHWILNFVYTLWIRQFTIHKYEQSIMQCCIPNWVIKNVCLNLKTNSRLPN